MSPNMSLDKLADFDDSSIRGDDADCNEYAENCGFFKKPVCASPPGSAGSEVGAMHFTPEG